MALTKKQLDLLRQRLEDDRQEIVMQVRNAMGQGATFHGDWGDRSTSLAAIEGELDIEEFERQRLIRIEAALERMEEGVYGRCQRCQKEIPFERLQAVPDALYDAQCKEMEESGR